MGRRGPHAEDWTGRTVGRWTVEGPAPRGPTGIRWMCRCACGRRQPVYARNLAAAAKGRGHASSQCKACADRARGDRMRVAEPVRRPTWAESLSAICDAAESEGWDATRVIAAARLLVANRPRRKRRDR